MCLSCCDQPFFLHQVLGKVQECAQYTTHCEFKNLTKWACGVEKQKDISLRGKKSVFIKNTLITLA